MDYVLDLPFLEGADLMAKAIEKNQEQYTWEMYLAVLPNFTETTYKTFEEFKREAMKPSTPVRTSLSTEELIAQAERIKQADQAQRNM